MRKHTSRSATQNCFANVIFVLGLVLNLRRPQLATRTLGLPVANEGVNSIRHGAATKR
jgi:hypothetical protein